MQKQKNFIKNQIFRKIELTCTCTLIADFPLRTFPTIKYELFYLVLSLDAIMETFAKRARWLAIDKPQFLKTNHRSKLNIYIGESQRT